MQNMDCRLRNRCVAWTLLPAAFMWLGALRSPCRGVDLIGYIPNYRMGDANYVNNVLPLQLGMLDEVRYFGITVTASGLLTTNSTHLSHIDAIKQKIASLPADQRPRLGITLGGDGEDATFTAVAQNAALRTQLAQNINALLNSTGAAGVDVDWEHPDAGPDLTTHYPAMLSRIKQEIGASRRLYATVSPEKILPRSVFEGDYAVDGVSIMTYDLSWWANGPRFPELEKKQHSLHTYATETVDAWTNPAGAFIPRTWVFGSTSIDAPESKIGVGSPFYARGYDDTSTDLALAYSTLGAPWTTADGNSYHNGTQEVWLPGKELLADRVAYAEQRGLEHLIFWELYHDLSPSNPNSLLRTAYETRAALAGDFTADGFTDGADLAAWQVHLGAVTGVTGPMGDADNNNRVDGRDFLIWQRHAGGVGAHAVPEPLPHTLVALFMILRLTPRRTSARMRA
jgi:hypothetical protein